jgi:hypothetical protein
MKFSTGCVFALTAWCLATPSEAATIYLDPAIYFGGGAPGLVTAGPPGFVASGTGGALYGNLTNAPGYTFLNSASPFMAGVNFTFCVELNEQAVMGSAHSDYSIINPSVSSPVWGANSAGISSQIDKLMALAMPAIAAAPNAAALQTTLAATQFSLWELIYDYNASFNYSLSSGSLQINTNAAVQTQASSWLSTAALSAVVPTTHYFVAHDPSHQDLLVTAAVPEPATVALMVLGLAAVGGVAQRRRATA